MIKHEELTYDQAKAMAFNSFICKGHEVFIVDFNDAFGISMLVFRDREHIYYANDYQLHHHGMMEDDLVKFYVRKANNILFNDVELQEPCNSYDEYMRKSHYLHNYWIMRYPHHSMFYIGSQKEWEKANEGFDYCCRPCYCYVQNKEIVDNANKIFFHLVSEFDRIKDDENIFREMIASELANHEACITGEYESALEALGLEWKELTDEQKKIVINELRKQVYESEED